MGSHAGTYISRDAWARLERVFARGKAGVLGAAIASLVSLAITVIVLIVCNMGVLDFSTPAAQLSLLHLTHLVLALFAVIVYVGDAAFVPIWFALAGLTALVLDIYVLIARGFALAAAGFASPEAPCLIFLLLLDAILAIGAFFYLMYIIQTVAAFAAYGYWQGAFSGVLWPRRHHFLTPDDDDDEEEEKRALPRKASSTTRDSSAPLLAPGTATLPLRMDATPASHAAPSDSVRVQSRAQRQFLSRLAMD